MIKLTKKEKLIAGVFDFKKSLTEEEKIDIKETTKNRLNRVLLEGVIQEFITVDNFEITNDILTKTIETLLNTKVIKITESKDDDRVLYIVNDSRFKHIEILIKNKKVCVNPFWE